MAQTLNTATPSTGLILGGNITDADISLGRNTHGRIDIGNPVMDGPIIIETAGDLVLSGNTFEFHTKEHVIQLNDSESSVSINSPVGSIQTHTMMLQNHGSSRFMVYNINVKSTSAILLTIKVCSFVDY